MKNKRRKLSLQDIRVPVGKEVFALPESAARCTRCNACAQSCPAYLYQREEALSPRGRVQLVRLLAEQKIRPEDCLPLLKKVTDSCQLCARCTAACAGQVPVAHFMLALRKQMQKNVIPWPLKMLIRWSIIHPFLLESTLSAGQTLRKLGLVRLLNMTGLTRLPALKWIRHADDVLPHKTSNLRRTLKRKKYNIQPDKPDAIYLPSLTAQYADESVGLLSLQALQDKKTAVFFHISCGLHEYLYGKNTDALRAAKKLLVLWEKCSPRCATPLVTDSLEIYTFLKQYPVLLGTLPGWKKRAERLANKTHLIAEYIKPAKNRGQKSALDTSGLLLPAKGTSERVRKILQTHIAKNLLECDYSRFPLSAAAEAFACGFVARETALENVKDLARKQIRQVYCLSAWAALELDASLHRHYPAARAQHIVHLQDKP